METGVKCCGGLNENSLVAYDLIFPFQLPDHFPHTDDVVKFMDRDIGKFRVPGEHVKDSLIYENIYAFA